MKKASINNKLGKGSILLAALIIIFITILLFPVYILKASHYRDGEYLKSWLVKRGDSFSIKYTHSVQLTPVIEAYYIDEEGEIILDESYFYSYGAGLPSDTPYKFETTKNGFRIYDIDELMDNLIYRTGAVRANHKINIKGKTYPFLDFSEPRTGIKFEVEQSFLLQHILKEAYNVKRQINYRK
ncbi:MAG: DUF1850 domain-containing protein [Tissierellia bacterium]|nr:DUF1850 domain-containing protein [Tissierellia bacterium]